MRAGQPKPHPRPGAARHSQLKPPAVHEPVKGWLFLGSVDLGIPMVDIDRPDVAVVVIEDLCWRIAVADWAARRPPLWRRHTRAAWCTEGELLQDKQDGIIAMAAQAGMCL
jgi:hypothetical protein